MGGEKPEVTVRPCRGLEIGPKASEDVVYCPIEPRPGPPSTLHNSWLDGLAGKIGLKQPLSFACLVGVVVPHEVFARSAGATADHQWSLQVYLETVVVSPGLLNPAWMRERRSTDPWDPTLNEHTHTYGQEGQ